MQFIDLDRGATQRKHPDGYLVSMYKDDPGVYLGERGEPVGEDVAEAAGFDVRKMRVTRTKKALIAEETAKIEARFARAEERAEKEAEAAEANAEKLAEAAEGHQEDPSPGDDETKTDEPAFGDGPSTEGKGGKGGRGGR